MKAAGLFYFTDCIGSRARWKDIGEVFKVLVSSCLSLQLAKRWKDSDRDDFLDDFGSENEGDLRARKLKSPPVQQVRKEGLLTGKEKGRKEKGTVHWLPVWA